MDVLQFLLTLLAVLAGLAFAGMCAWVLVAAAAWLWFGRMLPVHEVHRVPVPGGWELAVHRVRPQGPARPVPVVLGHGLMMSRRCWDPGVGTSLARYLAGRGHDVWIAEYRGSGGSRYRRSDSAGRGAWDYDFDTCAREDVPAIRDAVRAATGAERVSWVGHSMGGLLAYAVAALRGDGDLDRLVTIGSPGPDRGRQALPLPAGARRALERVAVVHGDWWTRVGLPWMLVDRRWLSFSVNPEVASASEVLALMASGVQRVSSRLLLQFEVYNRTGSLPRGDGGTWDEAAAAVHVPLLVIAGARDRMAPPASVRVAYDRAASPVKRLRVFGDGDGMPPFGHLDLIASRAAREHVFPEIAAWLEADAAALADLAGEFGTAPDAAASAGARTGGP